MKSWSHLGRDPVRSAVAGLVAGSALGLVEVLILVGMDRLAGLALGESLGIVLAWGAMGLILGLAWGLWRARGRDAGPVGSAPARQLSHQPAPRGKRIARVGRSLAQGLGAGLVSGIAISLIEIAGLVIVDGSWNSLSGLLYAAIAYGLLGGLGGLILGLLWGLWAAWRQRASLAGHPVWPAFTTMIVSVGAFLVLHNRVRRSVLEIPLNSLDLAESLLVDNALLLPTIALGIGLWLLLRRLALRRWLVQWRWNAAAYLAFLLVAALLSNVPGLVPTPATPASALPGGMPEHLRDRPNVLFIVADALRADRLGCYGGEGNLTPNLDALARDGVVYRNMSAQAPWTCPSVATMLTSLYPSSHGARYRLLALPDEAITLPEVLSGEGYRAIGYTTNIQTSPRFNFQQGFDRYTFLMANSPYFAFDTPVATRFAVFAILCRLREAVQPVTSFPHDEAYQDAAVLSQRALAQVEANADTRFFLFLHYMDPHAPYFAHPYDGTSVSSRVTPDPPGSQAPYLRQLYDGETAYLDASLGQLLAQLKAWGLYDDMLIVFTSDHGEEFYEHQGWWHSETLYEELLAVPLIVKYPGQAHAGTVDDEIARSLDIAPTVLDVLGLPGPASFQGVSLRPGAAVARAEFAFAEMGLNRMYAIRTGQHKLIIAEKNNPRRLPPRELFDLRADPGEQQSLAASDPDTARQLRALLDQVVAYAQSHAVGSQAGELDATTRERLKELGY